MKYFLFDFDGTLVDSMPYFANYMVNVLIEGGIEPPNDIVKKITPLGIEGSAKYYVSLGLNATVEEIANNINTVAKSAYEDEIPLKEGVLDFLKRIKEQGISMSILTASPHRFLTPCLKRNGVYELFERIWSCEDFNTTKDDPEIYKQVAKELGCNTEDIIFFDDNIIALQTAKKAGCKTVGVFDETSEDMIEEIKQETDEYIYSFLEM